MDSFGGNLNFSGSVPLPVAETAEDVANRSPACESRFDESDDDSHIPVDNPHTGLVARGAHVAARAAQKSIHVTGGRAAQPKPIISDYDSDDGRIVTLKQQGYSDDYVADKLVREDRVKYVPKTISSRWLRLRGTLDKREQEILDDELSDWHEGEDDKLEASIKVINEKIEEDIKKLRLKAWKDVSSNLAERLQKRKYTARACRERREALDANVALPPIELDPDQEGRRVIRETRIAEAKRRRAEQRAAEKAAQDQKKWDAEAKKREREEHNRQKIEKELKKVADKRENERIKAQKQRIRVWRKEAREDKRQQWSRNFDWKQTRKATEKALLDRMVGKSNTVRRRSTKKKLMADYDSEADIDEEDYTSEESDAGGHFRGDSDDGYEGMTTITELGKRRRRTTTSGDMVLPNVSKKAKAGTTTPLLAKVTKATLENPRSIMTDAELETLMFARKQPRRGPGETQPQLVARLATADADLTNSELNDLLKEIFEPTTGLKADKVRRLQEWDASRSALGGEGVKSTHLHFKKGYEGYKGEYKSLIGMDGQENMEIEDEEGFEDIGIPRGAI